MPLLKTNITSGIAIDTTLHHACKLWFTHHIITKFKSLQMQKAQKAEEQPILVTSPCRHQKVVDKVSEGLLICYCTVCMHRALPFSRQERSALEKVHGMIVSIGKVKMQETELPH